MGPYIYKTNVTFISLILQCVSYQPRTVGMTDKLVVGELYVLPHDWFNLTVNVYP